MLSRVSIDLLKTLAVEKRRGNTRLSARVPTAFLAVTNFPSCF